MSFQEAVLHLPKNDVERWSDCVLELGALAVSAEDADAESLDEQPIYGEPGTAPQVHAWDRTRLIVLLAEGSDPAQLFEQVSLLLGCDTPTFERREVPDADWVRVTQAQYEPIPVGEHLLISPSWHAPATDESRIRIIVDPGLAFGTGSHPTTHLCLRWLESRILHLSDQSKSSMDVIDYGCGSGILAIAALRLGARHAVGIDIDPQALIASSSNAKINEVDLEVRSTVQTLPEPSQLVVANILASPLKLLAPLLISLVKPGGALALSGVLERQIQEVSQAYADHGMVLQAYAVSDGWACLEGHKA
jgi:ribosomal protein L11 methyltransferase